MRPSRRSAANSKIDKTYDTYETSSDPQIASIRTTIGTAVNQSTFTYGPYKNLIERDDYDFGVGAPGPRLRYITRTYLDAPYTGYNIDDRVASENLYDGGGTLIAQTQYEYDNYASPNDLIGRAGPIPNWIAPDYANNTRANVTKIRRWLNTTNTWLETRNQYDVLGNVVATVDPAGHTRSVDCTDCFYSSSNAQCNSAPQTSAPPSNTVDIHPTYAFPAKVTDENGFFGQSRYDFNTGLVKDATDSLNRTTRTTYDVMNRQTAINYPNGGRSTYSYVDGILPGTAPQTTKQVLVDTNNNLGTVTTIYDGLYRETQKRTADPAGTIYVDAQYDAKGRKWKISNPRL